MPKKQQLSPTQIRKLKAIKKDSNLRKNLEAFVKSVTGFTYAQISAKWYYLTKTKSKRAMKKVTDMSGSMNSNTVNTGGIVPYKIDKTSDVFVRTETAERVTKLKKLIPDLMKLQVKKWTVPIYRADITAMRSIFKDKSLQNFSFGIQDIKGNPKMSRVYRKA